VDDERLNDVLRALVTVARLMAEKFGGDADAFAGYADQLAARGDEDASQVDGFRRASSGLGHLRDAWTGLAEAAEHAGE
jgi:hypothetical protein